MNRKAISDEKEFQAFEDMEQILVPLSAALTEVEVPKSEVEELRSEIEALRREIERNAAVAEEKMNAMRAEMEENVAAAIDVAATNNRAAISAANDRADAAERNQLLTLTLTRDRELSVNQPYQTSIPGKFFVKDVNHVHICLYLMRKLKLFLSTRTSIQRFQFSRE